MHARHSVGRGLSAEAGLWEHPAAAGWEKVHGEKEGGWKKGKDTGWQNLQKNCYSKSKPTLPQHYPPTTFWLLLSKGHLRSSLPLEKREEDGAGIKQGAAE